MKTKTQKQGFLLTFSMSFGTYMFSRATRENTLKCATVKAHSSKTQAKPIQSSILGQAPAWEWLRPSQKPTCQGRWPGMQPRVRPHPQCTRTAPNSASPHLLQAAHLMPKEVGCMVAYQKYPSKPSYSSYIRRPPLHIQDHHTLGEEDQEYLHFLISFQLCQHRE